MNAPQQPLHARPQPNPATDTLLVLGAGHCGGRTVQALRAQGWSGRIDLVGAEPHAPYERPPLSKDVLTGTASPQACTLAPALTPDAVLVRHVARAVALDAVTRTVQLADGTRLSAHGIVLATGGTPRRLTCPGADLPGVEVLRTLEDAERMRAHLIPGQHIVVVGGGFIGLEVAASARQCGVQVTLLEGGPRLMGRAVPEDLAERAARLHRARGVDLRLGCGPEAISVCAEGLRVQCTDGRSVTGTAVVAGIGIEPDVALARAAGLTVRSGIVVDAALRTSAPGILAAGDVAEFPGPRTGQLMRQETWFNAEVQARVAATVLLGGSATVTEPPWFWSDQFDHQLQVCGEPAAGTHTVSRPGAEDDLIRFSFGAAGQVVAACGWGRTARMAKDLRLARMLVERGAVIPPEHLADPAMALRALLRTAA